MSENEKHESAETHVRTCVGCGSKDDPAALVRLVFDVASGGVLVDAKGKAFGRGAHVHPVPQCVQNACKSGLAKAFRTNVKASPAELAADISAALDRRIEGLVVAARGAGALAVGTDKALASLRMGAPLTLVAKDATSIAEKSEVMEAVGEGRALVWRDKAGIGRVVDKGDVAVVTIENSGIARAIGEAARAIASLHGAHSVSQARSGSEVR